MKSKHIAWKIAGLLNLFTALLHLIQGQIDLVNPLLGSDLAIQAKTELLGVWHMATIVLFASSFIFLRYGFDKKVEIHTHLSNFISYLYIAFSIAFIIISISQSTLAPQWVLLLPIGILGLLGSKK